MLTRPGVDEANADGKAEVCAYEAEAKLLTHT